MLGCFSDDVHIGRHQLVVGDVGAFNPPKYSTLCILVKTFPKIPVSICTQKCFTSEQGESNGMKPAVVFEKLGDCVDIPLPLPNNNPF